jgi:hypothetical protein
MANPKSRVLGRDDILAAPDIHPQKVEMPEWGGCVYVRGLTARERDAFESSIVSVDKNGERKVNARNVRARLVALGVCDEAGQPVFTENDVNGLGKKSALALERLFDTIRHLSGMTDADLAELEGNSDGQSGGSLTD